ncbi:MAG: TRAM domain-containing protein [Chlamydiota bacterium]|nr:TRAM domain-containing protein [Chlamydiota bacterium]
MDVSLTFIRIIFLLLCALISTTYTTSTMEGGLTLNSIANGIIAGGVFGTAIIGLDTMFRRFNLRSFNIAILGMFFGYLLAQAIVTIMTGFIDFGASQIDENTLVFIKASIYLSMIYIGMVMTARAAEELYVSLPFFKLKSTSLKKKDILIDSSILNDARLIDLASSGLLDNHLVIPRFIINELYAQNDKGDEATKNRARKGLETIKKLESLHSLDLRYTDNDFPEIKAPLEKLTKLARMMDANIITADMSQIQQSSVEDVRIIKFQQLCNALKPLSQTGEFISIKIQRYGKEPRQGVGYLDDGTMVVVNGGAEFIGDSIKAQVLSVKHTSSGRMIFCNALEENLLEDEDYDHSAHYSHASHQSHESDEPAKNYFTM